MEWIFLLLLLTKANKIGCFIANESWFLRLKMQIFLVIAHSNYIISYNDNYITDND